MAVVKEPSPLSKEKRESRFSPKLLEKVKEETRKVKGRFRIYEKGRESGWEKVTFQKYHPSLTPMFSLNMQDGEVYEIPLYVARFLNGFDSNADAINGKIGSCSYPVHGFKWEADRPMPENSIGSGANGQPGIPLANTKISKRMRRFGFESLEFDSEDTP